MQQSSLAGQQRAGCPRLALLWWLITECLLVAAACGAKLQPFSGDKYLNASLASPLHLGVPISLTPLVTAGLWARLSINSRTGAGKGEHGQVLVGSAVLEGSGCQGSVHAGACDAGASSRADPLLG